jgi:predicted phage tail protein
MRQLYHLTAMSHLQEMENLQTAHHQQLQQLARAHQQQLSTAASESSAALSRHMGLIDRLMEEKAQLANKVEDAQRAAVVSGVCHCLCGKYTAQHADYLWQAPRAGMVGVALIGHSPGASF